MRARTTQIAALASWLGVAACGCGGGGGGNPDAARPDARPIDAGAPDAEDLCPGELTFQAFVNDLQLSTALFDFAVEGNPGHSTTSAPNGRAVLCLAAGERTLHASKTDYVPRVDVVTNQNVIRTLHGENSYPLEGVTTASLATLLDGLGVVQDPAKALVIVSVRSYPDGLALVGSTVTLGAAHDGTFARDNQGAFAAATAVAAGGLLLFTNVDGATSSVSVTPPAGFTGTCAGPADLVLEAGAIGGGVFACE